jgi:CheY-like chemotaxis protein
MPEDHPSSAAARIPPANRFPAILHSRYKKARSATHGLNGEVLKYSHHPSNAMHNPFILQSGIRSRSPLPAKASAVRVLVVDDDPDIAQLLASLLARNGFSVEALTESKAALARLAAGPALFDALVTDHDMPQMCGCELIDRARAAGFRGKVILHSGSLSGDDLSEKVRRVDAALEKPLGIRSLVPTLRDLLGMDAKACA